MGTSAETANVDYRLLFIVCRLRKTNSRFSAFRIHICTYLHISIFLYIYLQYFYISIYIYMHNIYIYMLLFRTKMENGSPGNFPFCLPSAQQRKFVICPFVYKETNEVIHSFAIVLNGRYGLAHSCRISICM
jgi:hypothetical protein